MFDAEPVLYFKVRSPDRTAGLPQPGISRLLFCSALALLWLVEPKHNAVCCEHRS
jgi:hypothetical protein